MFRRSCLRGFAFSLRFLQAHVQPGGENLEAIAAAVLGSVECGVGVLHQYFGIHLSREGCFDPNADRNPQLDACKADWP